jgi:hypothetical protein
MGWSKWFSSGGSKVSTKTESSGNRVSTHTLRSVGGSKSNHTHVVTHTNTSTGRTTAHGAGPKSKR